MVWARVELELAPAATAAERQACFDRFRNDFNDNQPHEALGQVPPTSRYRPLPRLYPDKIEELWSDADQAVRKVRSNGGILGGGETIFLSEALIGEPVGIAESETGIRAPAAIEFRTTSPDLRRLGDFDTLAYYQLCVPL